jgi:ABC-type Co2+ transport system permease subunit
MYLNIKEIIKRIIKYLVEGLAVGTCAAIVPQKALKIDEILIIALVAAASFSILDTFIPVAGTSIRQGAGAGLGFKLVGFGL